jgi:hypothetical protein
MNIHDGFRLPNLAFYNIRRLCPLVLAQKIGVVL